MILQSLSRYYDILQNDPNINLARFGFSVSGASFALEISTEGKLLNILPLFEKVQRGKKILDVPRSMVLPARIKRSVNIAPNFLWDNNVYVLGISEKDEQNPEYSLDRFNAFRVHHKKILGKVDCPAAKAVLAFLENHEPSSARNHPIISKNLEALLKGGNLVFMFQGAFVHNDSNVLKSWEDYQFSQTDIRAQCLVTGEFAPISRLHPSIKGVRGAQSSGATLVGFNLASFRSYNRDSKNERGLNSPVSTETTFKYSTILNFLLSDANPNKKFFLGDTTVIYWAESNNRAFENAFANFVDPSESERELSSNDIARKKAERTLKTTTEKVKRVQMVDMDALLEELKGENPRFYILGLSPNAARVSVRFFITDPFEKIVQNIKTHYRDLEIVKEYDDQPKYILIRRMLYEIVSKKTTNKEAAPLLAGAVFQAILTNSQYPAALYYAIINRIRADMDDDSKGIKKINYVRASIIKAYLLRKYRHFPDNPFKEVLIMALNKNSTIPAYLLGRLFAVLEKVQGEAIGNVNASIKDRYFTSACASPASVFPILLRLSQHHISKVEYGYVSDRRIQEIMNLLDVEKNPIPSHLSLDEQGVFVLGYYHQRADFYVKNNNKENPTNDLENKEI